MKNNSPTSGGKHPSQIPASGKRLTTGRVTPSMNDAIVVDIAAMKEADPAVSGCEIGRVLGAKYGVSGAAIWRRI